MGTPGSESGLNRNCDHSYTPRASNYYFLYLTVSFIITIEIKKSALECECLVPAAIMQKRCEKYLSKDQPYPSTAGIPEFLINAVNIKRESTTKNTDENEKP